MLGAGAGAHKACGAARFAAKSVPMVPRLFVAAPLRKGAPARLSSAQERYLARVLRLRPGASVVVFDGTGGEWTARWEGGEAVVPLAFRAAEREARLRLVLAQALVAREKLELVVQKATELGVSDLLLFPARRSSVRMPPARRAQRLARLHAIAVEAAEQCGRTRIPRLALVAPEALAPAGLALALDPDGDVSWGALAPRLARARAVTLLVGPEGGFADDERAALAARGFVRVRLGARVLRTETAGLAALAGVLAAHPGGWAAEG